MLGPSSSFLLPLAFRTHILSPSEPAPQMEQSIGDLLASQTFQFVYTYRQKLLSTAHSHVLLCQRKPTLEDSVVKIVNITKVPQFIFYPFFVFVSNIIFVGRQ